MLRICLQTTTQMAPAAPPPVLRRIWHVDPPDFAEADDDWCFMCEVGEEGHDNPFYRMLVEHINKTSGLVLDEALCQDVQDIYNRELRPHQVLPRDWIKCKSKNSKIVHVYRQVLNSRGSESTFYKGVDCARRGKWKTHLANISVYRENPGQVQKCL